MVGAPGVELVDQIGNQPIAMTMFGLGLLLLAVSGIATALAWQRSGLGRPWAAWPVGLGVALVLLQFFLPPSGRMAFGIAYAIAAGVLVFALARRSASSSEIDRPAEAETEMPSMARG